VDSSLDLQRDTFARLYHVNQVHLSENRIGKVESEAFGGMFTVGSIHLQSNQIGRIEPRAFMKTENLGSLTLSYNSIREPIESAECLENEASRFVFTENNLYCTCEMRWIQLYYQDQPILAENYCGREESFKALSYFKPLGCPPLPTEPGTTSLPAVTSTVTPLPMDNGDDRTAVQLARSREPGRNLVNNGRNLSPAALCSLFFLTLSVHLMSRILLPHGIVGLVNPQRP